jgi:hypothetical protein
MIAANSLTQCCAPGCTVLKASHLLMCWAHWRVLPDNIKQAVYSSHRQMQKGEGARNWMIARERARLFIAVHTIQPDSVQCEIEAEITRLEGVPL